MTAYDFESNEWDDITEQEKRNIVDRLVAREATLRDWLIDQAEQAKVGAERSSGSWDTGAAFDRGARHMAEATLTWLSEQAVIAARLGEPR